MTPKYYQMLKRSTHSCKREITLKSMGFLTLWNYIWSLTVVFKAVDTKRPETVRLPPNLV